MRASNWFYLSSMAAHFDGLAAIGAARACRAKQAERFSQARIWSPSRCARWASSAVTGPCSSVRRTIRGLRPRLARCPHSRALLVLPVVGQELDVVQSGLGSRHRDEHRVVLRPPPGTTAPSPGRRRTAVQGSMSTTSPSRLSLSPARDEVSTPPPERYGGVRAGADVPSGARQPPPNRSYVTAKFLSPSGSRMKRISKCSGSMPTSAAMSGTSATGTMV